MNMVDIILKKKAGEALSAEEIRRREPSRITSFRRC